MGRQPHCGQHCSLFGILDCSHPAAMGEGNWVYLEGVCAGNEKGRVSMTTKKKIRKRGYFCSFCLALFFLLTFLFLFGLSDDLIRSY